LLYAVEHGNSSHRDDDRRNTGKDESLHRDPSSRPLYRTSGR
jgi:hypothetical protein